MSFKTINYEANGPLAFIRLNRPDKLNGINRGYTIAGMREALLQGLETDIRIETTETDESRQFNDILKTKGTKAAMKWLDDRFKTDETTG
jgi:hypothetical protein